MNHAFVEHDPFGDGLTCTLRCPHCGGTVRGEPKQMIDGEWFYVCPSCGEELTVSERVRRALRTAIWP